jgi:putative endonuclease
MNYYIYILLCDNGAYYTGYTNNIERRYQAHISGKGKCKYTRSFKPIKIAQQWQIAGDKSLAMKLESFIKQMSRQKKEALITYPENLMLLFLAEKKESRHDRTP